ncbi:glycosyltransferase family 2 protein [Zhihengliuella halotolerans]|uniref:glycosyltransferase family 2 protein n=1 Tax=Zhihengliuella halotolerans TaxID=370736 RepID=UPI0015E09621|nr:glycosyltransferase family 2 protein [Zhihengliuella halotolerans]
MPRIRAVQRRALRHLGRALRARAPPAAKASGLIYEHLRVTAVVATRDGAAFLPRTLEALTGQSRPVDRFIGVDAASRDESADLLRAHLPADATIVSTTAHGFGHSVAAGLAAGPEPTGAPEAEWIWLIHDDSAPATDALEKLLDAVEASPSVTIAGCKQLDADRPRHLLDVGLSMSRAGERLTMIEAEELDQGQHDRRSDTFAVNSAGLLIRRDVWSALGGFDRALPGVGDDLDMCWRNRLAGHRVVVVPQARMYHVSDAVKQLTGPFAARRSQVYLRLKHAPLPLVPFIALFAVLGGLGRFLSGLVTKDPGHGVGQLGASLLAVLRPVRLIASRRSAARTRKQRRSAVASLMTRRRDVREHQRHLLAGHELESAPGEPNAASEASNPSGDDRDDFAELVTASRTSAAVSALVAVLVTAGLSLVGLRHLIGAQALTEGSMLPLSARLGDIWANATDWWQATGSGMPGAPDPFDYVLTLIGAAGGAAPNVAVTVFVLAAMPLSALFAWLALSAVTGSRGIRLFGAVAYALAPTLQVALGSGRLGAVVVHVLAPLVALGVIRSIGGARRRGLVTLDDDDARSARRPGVAGTMSWTAAAGAGLAFALVVAAAPALLLPAILAIAVVGVAAGRRAKSLWWIPVPALAMVAGLAVSAFTNLRVLLADPGVPQAFHAAPSWQQLLGFPVNLDTSVPPAGLAALPEGVPWLVVAAVLVALPALAFTVVGALGPDRAGWTARGALAAVVLLLVGSVGSQLIATSIDSGRAVTPFTGPFVSGVVLALLLAAAVGAGRLRFGEAPGLRAQAREGRAARTWAGIAAAFAAVSVLIAGAGFLAGGAGYGAEPQLTATTPRSLPATAADRGRSASESRTLVVTQGEGGVVQTSLASGAGSTLDSVSAVAEADGYFGPVLQAERKQDDDATTVLRGTVASIVSGQAIDPRADLSALGVDYVVLTNVDSSGDYVASQIDVVPGLASVGRTDAGWLWRVDPVQAGGSEESGDFTARVRVVGSNLQTEHLVASDRARVLNQDVPAGSDGRRVVLAERAATGWSATYDGRPLRATTLGWAQAFELPAEAGRLNIQYSNPWAMPVLAVQGLVLLIALLLVLPVRARRRAALVQPRWRTSDHVSDGPDAEPDDDAEADEHLAADAEPAVPASTTKEQR